jgi:DNA (cytosine-5)-methyltransferase 1
VRGLIIDSFAGGGGTSTGIEMALGRSPDVAINHDAEAIRMHMANHPKTRHYVSNVWDVDPVEATGGQQVALFWLSPDCTYHSKARGGKPHRDRNKARRIRGLPWVAVRWAKAVRPAVIAMENVEEIADWGPMGTDGRPCPLRKGFTFRRFVAMLSNLGYTVDWQELVAADYGAPTTRKRLFLIARCDGRPIVWPEPTHGKGRSQPWRAAAECIDFSLPCPSIFERSRPLAENTLRRIARGIRRFVIEDADPFIVPLRGTSEAHSSVHDIHDPLSTVSAGGTHHALIAPFITEHANASNQRNMPADEPLRTVCANVKGGHFGLVAPVLIQTRNGERDGQAPRVLDVRGPLNTVTAKGSQGALVSAFLAKHYGGHENDGIDLRLPMSTITTQDHHALVTAFLVAYYGNERDGGRLSDPMRTLTTKERFGLVTVRGEEYRIADIGMRMLQPRELYLAQGFPPDYIIDRGADGMPFTKTAQVRMCGNSVSPPIAAAIVRANLSDIEQQEAA